MLLRFAAPHSAGFMKKWVGELMDRLPDDFPSHELRILDFHDYITMIYDDADTAGRILRQARPHIVLKGDAGTERVVVIRDRPPEIRRRNLGLQPIWEAIEGTDSGKVKALRPLHRAKGKHKHTQYHLLEETTDESKCVATVGWTDDGQGFRVLQIEVDSDAPDDVRDALAQISLLQPGCAPAPPEEAHADEEMAPAGPSA